MSQVAARFRHFLRDDEAATMPEYALMVALIAVVCIIAVTAVGVAANGKFTAIGQAIAGA
jgi:pilus assembly protein Flp/PilA